MILTGKKIYEEILEYADGKGNHELNNIQFVSIPNLLNDLESWLQAEDYDELKQCVSDFINELEESKLEHQSK